MDKTRMQFDFIRVHMTVLGAHRYAKLLKMPKFEVASFKAQKKKYL